MGKERDTVTYALYDGRKKERIGETNDPERRAAEHTRDGLKFTRMEMTSRRMTEDGALAKEQKQLKSYQSGHGGRLPKYNKDPKG